MQNDSKIPSKIFTAVSVLGAFFVLTETILQAFGKSICSAVGCKLVAQYTRFGDISILLIGLSNFFLLALLAIINRHRSRPALESSINLILIISLASEGFFTGYQAFRLHAACVFCLVVFGFLVSLSVIRLIQGEKAIIAGFASLIAVFSLFYLILPAEGTATIPSRKQLVLFYGKDCKYCAEVMKEIDERQLPVDHVLVNEYSGFLKSMGIEHVPTLYVNKNNEKIFLTGKESILAYLTCKQEETAKGPAKTEKRPKKENNAARQSNIIGPSGPAGQTTQTFELVLPPSEEGICKSDEKCK
jgi:hypothetical protein